MAEAPGPLNPAFSAMDEFDSLDGDGQLDLLFHAAYNVRGGSASLVVDIGRRLCLEFAPCRPCGEDTPTHRGACAACGTQKKEQEENYDPQP